MKRIYFDYAATTPMDKEVIKTITPYFNEKFGNPGSLHYFGQEAIAAVDASRETIAKTIGANFNEIIFTGSATEANNLALRGAMKTTKPPYRIIVSKIEHESILDTVRDLEKEGAEVIYLPVDKQGSIDLKKLKESLNERTILVSIIYANNEIGTVQPIQEIAKIINDFKEKRSYPLFHTDAVQAFQFLNCDVNNLGIDLMTLSAHKIYGPKGIGALYAANKIQPLITPIITGGGQEFGFRSGTENAPAIVGFAKAIELTSENRAKETKKISELTDYFWREIKKISPKAEINGNANLTTSQAVRLPNILNIFFPGQNAQDLLIKLDINGVAVSSGSACSARAFKPSYVLKAIGLPDNKIKSSLRFSFGKPTTKTEINLALKIIKKVS